MEMKWMKSNIDNYKCSMLIFVVHQLFDKNTKKKVSVFLWTLLSNWVMNCKSCQVSHKPL